MKNYYHPSSYIAKEAFIGSNTKIWHFCHIMKGTVIGSNCSFGQNCVVGPYVRIGNNVKVQNNVSLYQGLIIEDDVFIGPSAVFTNVINPRSFISRKSEFKETILGKGCSIGANVTIICGNRIGGYSMIGAGSVITKDVPNHALVVGNPGRVVGWVSRNGHRLDFDEKNIGFCPETKEKYELLNGKTLEPLS